MMTPASPENTCSSVLPCRCEWYQYVPGDMSGGILIRTALSLPGFMTRRTLSEMPDRRGEEAVGVQVRRLAEPVLQVDLDRVAGAHVERRDR